MNNEEFCHNIKLLETELNHQYPDFSVHITVGKAKNRIVIRNRYSIPFKNSREEVSFIFYDTLYHQMNVLDYVRTLMEEAVKFW